MEIKFPPDDATPDEVLAWAEEFGVDLSMLRERLRMTPTERVERSLQALALAEAFRNSRKVSHVSAGTVAKRTA